MKDALKWVVLLTILFQSGYVLADPIKDNVLDNYRAGWYPNIYKKKLLTCPQTCKLRVKGVAEHENSAGAKGVTYVCKIGERRRLPAPLPRPGFLYGNQFNNVPVCSATNTKLKVERSKQFYCLCLARAQCTLPDLIVTKIENPQWDSANHRSVIKAVIKNIGSTAAAASIARVIDPSTNQSTGAPYNAIANTPPLAPGASVVVTFYLPYWVYNPDADLEVTADYKNMVKECNENNNTKKFHAIG